MNFSRSRRALVQPRFLLAMTAMASAVGGISYLATAQTGRAPVKMRAAVKNSSPVATLDGLSDWVKRAGATGKLPLKAASKKSGRSAQAVVNGNNVSGFNLNDVDLTPNSPSDEREPFFSPAGDLITFRSNGADSDGDGDIDQVNSNARYHVWVMNSDGSDQRQVTGLAGNDDANRNQFRPSWSPDGNQLLYVDERVPNINGGGTADQLFVVSALDSGAQPEQRTFFTGEKRAPVFAPNGLTIVFATKADPATGANLGQFDLFSIDPGGDGGTAQRLTGGTDDPGGNNTDDLNPAFSLVDGNSIYFSSNRDDNGKISGRRIWRLNGATTRVVTDPSQRPGFRGSDVIFDDFPTLSLAKNFSPRFGGGEPTNNANRNVTEQLAFQTNSRLNDSDNTLDLNIWDLPTQLLPEAAGAAFILTNSFSSPDTDQPEISSNGNNAGAEDFAPDREPSFGRSIVSPQSIGALAFSSQRAINPNPGATRQNPTGGNGVGSTGDIFVTGTVDTTPPTLVPQSIGNQQFPVVSPLATVAGQGQGNPRTFEAGLRPGATPGTPGSLKIAVVIDERESGLDRDSSVVAVIRNAEKLEVAQQDLPIDESVSVSTALETGYTQDNAYALTAVDDGAISEKQAGARAGDGIYYCSADVDTPPDGEYYIDIVVTDRRQNTFTFDNIWGFATRRFNKTKTDLLVSDYAVGQRFPNILSGTTNFFDEGGDDSRFANMFSIESYLIRANGPLNDLGIGVTEDGKFSDQSTANAFSNADVYRILCRGPITAAQLNIYRPTIATQIDPNEASFKPGKALTAKTRRVVVAQSSVAWASPYTGTVFRGPGTLDDPTTQSLLTDFSNQGGRLFVMGRDIGFGLTQGGTVSSDFMNTVLGADWGGDVQTGSGSGRDPGVIITAERGDFIKPTLSYGRQTSQDNRNLEVPFHFERKDKLTDTWLDASRNLDPNVSNDTTSDGSGSTFFRQAVGVQPDELTPTNPGGSVTEESYSIGGRTVGQRLSRKIGSTEARSVVFGFGLESINRRYRKPTMDFGVLALDARAQVVRGVNSYLKTGSLSGIVINASTNQPIANFLVRVTLENDPSVVYLARTDANGFYSVVGLPETLANAGYRVEPAIIDANGKLLPLTPTPKIGQNGAQTSPGGFFSGTPRRTVEIVGGSNTPNVNLRPIPIAPGSLRGRVVTTDLTNPAKQVPAVGLFVLARSVREISTPSGTSGGRYAAVVRTDATGNFSFSGVPSLTDIEVVLNPTLDDIPEASVRNNFVAPAFTGVFQNPSLGRRVISGLSRPGGSATPTLQVPNGGTFVLNDSNPDDKNDSNVPLLLARFLATLNGKVTVNGVPTRDITVELLDKDGKSLSPARTTTTDTAGNYSIVNVPAGSYIVKATTRLGATNRTAVFTVVNNSATASVTVKTINIIAPLISGKVNLRLVGTSIKLSGLPNATVELLTDAAKSFSPPITTNTDSGGKYSFNVALNGSYKVRATIELDGIPSTSETSATIKATGNVIAPDLTITRFQISGVVRNSAGAPQSRAIVELSQGDNTLRSITASSGGNFVFSNLLPGSYTVKAFASATAGSATGSATVVIRSTDTSVNALTITLNGTSPIGPIGPGTDGGVGTGVDGGGTVSVRTFAPNGTYTISYPYAIDNKLGTVTVDQAFGQSVASGAYKLYFFNAAKQINNLSKDLVQITSGTTQLVRGQGYVLVTGNNPVTMQTPTQNASLKSFAGTSYPIPLTWNTSFLSDTSEPDNRNNGYNLIGFPFNPAQYGSVSFTNSQVKYGDITYNSINEATAAGIISRQLFVVNSSGVRTAVDFGDLNIRAFNGYFVRILRKDQAVTLILRDPVK